MPVQTFYAEADKKTSRIIWTEINRTSPVTRSFAMLFVIKKIGGTKLGIKGS
jgi:hypothetical protein